MQVTVKSVLLFMAGGVKAVFHGNLYRCLVDRCTATCQARRDAKIFSVLDLTGFVAGLGRKMHIVVDLETSKRVLSDRTNFEKGSFPGENKVMSRSLLNAGDHPKLWGNLKRALLKEAIPACIKTAERLSIEDVAVFPTNVEIDLYDVLFDWVLTYQSRLFLHYDMDLEHPDQKGYFFRSVIDRIVSGLDGRETQKDKHWIEEQVHAAMKASLKSNDRTCMGRVMAESCPEQHYENVYMLFIAVTPVFALFWSIIHHIKNPEATVSGCFERALCSHSPVPVMYHRIAKNDTALDDGSIIRKGERMIISPLIVNEKANGCASTAIPFGYGQHTCLAKYFVKALLPRFLKHFFQNYSIQVTENMEFLDRPHPSHQIDGAGSAYSRPAERVKVVLSRKESNEN